jgi:hypothetical protein
LLDDVDETSTPAKVVPTIYSTQRDKTDEITYATTTNFNDANSTCANLVSEANKYSAAYAAVADGSMTAISGATSGAGEESCTISGIGWIVCPVITFMAKMSDIYLQYMSRY